MPLFKIKTRHLKDYSVDTEKFSNTAVAAFAKTLTPKVRLANTANVSYIVSAATAVNLGGGYIVLTGTDFQSGAQVLVGNTPATSTSFVNSTILRAEVPARPAGTYNLYVVNPDGGTSIRVNGITYSAVPTFSTDTTLTQQRNSIAFGLNLSASSDSNVNTYANTTTLPVGTTLLANGYFYAPANTSANSDTTYTFTAKAIDAELQEGFKEFNITFLNKRKLYAWGVNTQGQLGENDTINRSSPSQVGSSTDWNWSQINSSFDTNTGHTIGIKDDGTLWVWGQNDRGQLGISTVNIPRSSPTQIGALTNWSKVSAGALINLAIKTDGTLWSWGYNGEGQLGLGFTGTGNSGNRSSPVQIGTGTNWTDISSGGMNLALKTDGTLWSWGYNIDGRVGDGTRNARSVPVAIGVGSTWTSISAGSPSMAIKNDGTLWTWGLGTSGQLGSNTIVSRSTIAQVGTDTNWSNIITSGYACALAVKTDGTLWTWGQNNFGQLGLNDRVYRSSPVQVGTGTNWSQTKKIHVNGLEAIMAAKTDGTLWTWGKNDLGQLGLNDRVYRSSPVQVPNIPYWSNIHNFDVGFIINDSSISDFPLFDTNATLSNEYGDYPIGFNIVATSDSAIINYANTTALPVGTTLMSNGWFYGANTVSTDTNYTFTVQATDDESQSTLKTFTLPVKVPYKIWSWGSSNRGQLGLNTVGSEVSSPTQVGGKPDWTKISASKASSYPGILARRDDGTLWSWGVNYTGQLGVGATATITGRSSPTQINASTDWSNNFAINNTQSVAIKNDNTLWIWGNAADGAQGNNSRTADRTSPAMLDGGAFTWLNASAGDNAGFAVKSNGTLWGWGRGSNGQQGSNTILARSSPVQIGALTNWSDVRSGNFACIAIKNDGTLWSWGYGAYGFTGHGDQVDRSSPVQVGSETNWSKIYTSNGSPMVAAIKTNGTLWTWGRNNYGQLGHNDGLDKYVPTQVGSGTDWTDVGLGEGYMAAIRSNGTLWTCGRNVAGQLGLNLSGDVSSPTQVGTGTNWYQVAGGIDACFAITRN
jgi:alpha-tubulin suppressor-like RCC1 family protein